MPFPLYIIDGKPAATLVRAVGMEHIAKVQAILDVKHFRYVMHWTGESSWDVTFVVYAKEREFIARTVKEILNPPFGGLQEMLIQAREP
jgi:hypothetical protein